MHSGYHMYSTTITFWNFISYHLHHQLHMLTHVYMSVVILATMAAFTRNLRFISGPMWDVWTAKCHRNQIGCHFLFSPVLIIPPTSHNIHPSARVVSGLLAARCRCVKYTRLTLILLTWRIWWASNNASKWQMGFNWAFKGFTKPENRPIVCHCGTFA